MKLIYSFIILILFQNCSFDDKTGIWKNSNKISKKENNLFEEFKKISPLKENFNKIIPLDKNYKFLKNSSFDNKEWKDIYFSEDNNLKNFDYYDLNQLVFKSKKITRGKINEYILFEKNNLIINDNKGNIFVFSINKNAVIAKFNFYKKRYKKIDKALNLIIENSIIYTSDNLGYIYAYNYKQDKLLWAKNYKIPFRSNIKISKNKIILSNQNNSLLFIDKYNGQILKKIPTEESIVKNNFKNNLVNYKNNTLFLNTYGSLYLLNNQSMTIKWFINLNPSLDINASNLFNGSQFLIYKNKIIVPTNKNLYILDLTSGSIIFKKDFTSVFKPIILNNILFSLHSNLLIATDLNNGKIIYSYDINQLISDFLNTKKNEVEFKTLMLANNQIFIFLENSYVIKLNLNGTLDKIDKLPTKINSLPIFISKSIIFLNNKNKISVIN
jgi:outer membrane protein assembly factor BamB